MLNHHSITKLIISLTLTLLQCYFFNTLSVDYIYTGSVDLTLEVLLCRIGEYIISSAALETENVASTLTDVNIKTSVT